MLGPLRCVVRGEAQVYAEQLGARADIQIQEAGGRTKCPSIAVMVGKLALMRWGACADEEEGAEKEAAARLETLCWCFARLGQALGRPAGQRWRRDRSTVARASQCQLLASGSCNAPVFD
jgi:hypothetical protein